tara:strand:- start:10854 stop:11561 length:708 start_codon:yes stop_codon:yes gene_type:complete
MKINAVITARSGSKSVSHKNIRILGSIPLLGWVVKTTKDTSLVDNVFLSTDSQEYFEIAKKFNKNIILHKRNSELAEDVPSELVLLDLVKKYNSFFDKDSILVLIQPTTPFIEGSDINSCIKKLSENSNKNTCISVKKVSEYPEWMIKQKDACSDIGIANDMSGSKGVRQNLVKRWIPNGGIYVIRTNFLLKHKKCIDDETLVYEMSKLNSLDIDDEDDFILCESLIKSGFINKN